MKYQFHYRLICCLCAPFVCSLGACTSDGARSDTTRVQATALGSGFNSKMYRAAERGNRPSVKYHLDKGADINAREPATGRTVLHAAAFNGHPELIEFLLSRGADVTAMDAQGNTPLHLAAMRNHDGAVSALLASSSLDTRNKSGKTARQVAGPNALGKFPPQ